VGKEAVGHAHCLSSELPFHHVQTILVEFDSVKYKNIGRTMNEKENEGAVWEMLYMFW
jgi:hypothetical protein